MLNASLLQFHPLAVTDIPLLHRWLREDPLLMQIWWQGTEEPYEQFARKYMARIAGEELVSCYLILYGETPIGFIQSYLWRDHSDYTCHVPQVDWSDSGSLDLFIGLEEYRGRGLGVGLLQRFLREVLFADPAVQRCIIAPEVENAAALRAYEKAGFRHLVTVEGIPGEPGPVYFMGVGRGELPGS